MKKRSIVTSLAAVILLAAPLLRAEAQVKYPLKEVRIVVPWAAGGFTDRLARMLGEKLSARLGQPVVVDNKPGASGLIGSEFVMRAPPDGHTLLLQTSDGMVKMLSTDKVDAVRDFTNIAILATQPVTLSVGEKVPFNTLQEFVRAAKAKPGAISYASNGEGGATHLGMEMFASQAGIKLLHVPYKGAAGAVTDLLGGSVQAILLSVQGLKPHFDSGKVRGLAITTPQRSPAVPKIPTFAEAGYPNFQMRLWYSLAGPKGMPDAVTNRLNKEVGEILAQPEFAQTLLQAAADPMISTPIQARAFVANEASRWKAIVPKTQTP